VTGVRELVAVAVSGGPAFVETLQRVWDRGDALLPIDPRLPEHAVERLLDAMRPSALIDADGDESRRPGGQEIEDGDALIVATSGSTGTPKGAVHTHRSVAASASATSARLGVDPDRDRWLCCLPLAHVAGLSVVTRALHTGTPLEVHDRFDAAAVVDAARRGATLSTVVPTALARFDPSLFRKLVVGGSAPPVVVPPNAVISYGMTETGSAFVYDGVPLDGVDVRIVEGEIQVRGPMLLRCYRDGSDPLDADGWLPTNDAGEWGPDGRLVVHGRRGDLIISGGENVWPTAVELVLNHHPSVAEVAVIGRPHPEWGQQVVAVVVPADATTPPDLEELRAHVKVELPAYAAPRSLEIVTSLPRTLLGKVERHAL
jgi:O-succinylbenzoic acid--CoA ligase